MSKAIIQNFVEAINQHSLEKLEGLMTEEHTFIDAHHNSSKGKQHNIAGWEGYFLWFPNYKIEVEKILTDKKTYAIFGFAEGTFSNLEDDIAKFKLPASWRAEVVDGKVSVWQVYADTKIPYEIIERFSEKPRDTQKVQGFGGVFIKSENPQELCAWYDRHLGTSFGKNDYQLFRWRSRDDKEEIGSTTFSIFKQASDYFGPSKSPFMLNLRVKKLDAFLERLKSEGVQVFDKTESYEYGKFGWIMDPDGNKIELWEASNEELFDQ